MVHWECQGSTDVSMRIPLSIRQLEAILCVGELGGFSEASKVLHISQPALSRTIQNAEAALGARLFDRDTRSVELTAVGKQFLPIARRVVNDFRIALGEMSQFLEGLYGKVTVATLASVATTVLAPVIAQFRKTHPNVEFKISDQISQRVADAVADGTADFGVAIRAVQDDRVAYSHLIRDNIVLVCRADDPLASQTSVSWSVFKTRTFIGMDVRSSVRPITDAIFMQMKLGIKQLYECQNIATMGSLIEAGLGISALPTLALSLIGAPNVVARPLIRPDTSRSVGIITRPGRSLSPPAEEFLKAFVKTAPQIAGKIGQGSLKG